MPGSDGDGPLVEQVSLRRLPPTAMGFLSQAGFESGVDRGRRRDGFPAVLSLPGNEPAKLTSSWRRAVAEKAGQARVPRLERNLVYTHCRRTPQHLFR
jgi:hypothetical protein